MFRNNLLLLLDTISICLISGLRLAQTLENIAHIKAVSQSSTFLSSIEYKANNAMDGNISTCAHGDREPNSLNWWKVDLLSVYYISQVILTPRQDFNEPGRMDYVFIGISNSPNISGKVEYPVYPLCRQSTYKVHKTYDAYQNISCRPNTPPGRYVFVQQPTTSPGYLTISEIQVYGIRLEINSLGNSTCQGNYYGDKCDKYCNCDKGVKCDQQGICPNGCDANWEGEHCDKRRFNDNQLMGCFQYDNSPTHEFYQLDSHGCIDTCSGYGFIYAANLTNTSCICTNTLNSAKSKNFEFCLQQCSSQSCQSVFYSVCPNGTYGYDCTLKCNCLNNGRCSYMEGRCEDGCASGWTGASCDIRDCSKYNGGCGEWETCVSDSSGVASCQCTEGLSRTSAFLPCQRLSDSSPMSYQSKSAIIGGVVGSLGVLCLIVVFITLLVKYRKRLKGSNSTSEKPSFQNEGANSTSTNPELYETFSTTDMKNENKYQSLKVTKNKK